MAKYVKSDNYYSLKFRSLKPEQKTELDYEQLRQVQYNPVNCEAVKFSSSGTLPDATECSGPGTGAVTRTDIEFGGDVMRRRESSSSSVCCGLMDPRVN